MVMIQQNRDTFLQRTFLTVGVLMLATGLLTWWLEAELYDPLFLRVLLSLTFFVPALLSYRLPFFARRLEALGYWLTALTLAWICLLLVKNNFSIHYAISIPLAQILLGFVVTRLNYLRIYLLCFSLTTIGIGIGLGKADWLLAFLMLIPVGGVMSYFIQWQRLHSLKAYQTKVKELDELSRHLASIQAKQAALLSVPHFKSVLLDEKGAVQAFNASAKEAFDALFGGEIAVGKPFLSFALSPSHREQIQASIERAMQGHIVEDERELWLNGKRVFFRVVYSPAKDATGLVHGVAFSLQDLTTEWEREKALRYSEKRFIDVVDAAGEYVWEVDAAGRFIFVSDRVTHILGYEPREMVGRSPISFVPEDQRTAVVGWFNSFDPPVAFRNLEFPARHKEGPVIWQSLSGKPFFDEEGTLLGFRGACLDITESRQNAISLQKREAEQSALLDAIPDMIFRLDAQGYCLDFRPAVNEVFHQDPSQVIGKHLSDTPMSAAMASGLQALISQALASRQVESQTFAYTLGRREVYFEVRIIAVGAGEVVCIARDTTHANLNQQALKASEAKLRQILAAIPSPTFFKNEDGVFLDCNQALEAFLGRKREELLGKTVFDLMPPEDAAFFAQKDRELLAKGHRQQYEQTLLRADGQLRTLIFFKSVLAPDENGKQGIVGILYDITAQKENIRELEIAKNAAEAASQAKAAFLSTMSHEIRTPMNAVIGTTHLLLGETPRPDQREHLDTLLFSAENLLSLINDVLDYSKIEAGRIEIESVAVDLPSLLQQLKRTHEPTAQERGLSLTLEADATLPARVLSDPTRLGQILNNLLGNALKFTKQGNVCLEAKVLAHTAQTVTLRLGVKDTGIGIEASMQPRVFEEFTQAESDTTRRYGGTGLGLSISQRLLNLLHSKLQLQSQLGKGSYFFFDLTCPLATPAPVPAIPSPTLPSAAGADSLAGYRILIVEDNLINQKIACRFLEKWGAQVDTAPNGAEAVEKVQQTSFDLVLMDLQMPVMDGFEATQLIRALPEPKGQVPIIALTASALLEVQQEVKQADMNDYITKPFHPVRLQEKLHQWLVPAALNS